MSKTTHARKLARIEREIPEAAQADLHAQAERWHDEETLGGTDCEHRPLEIAAYKAGFRAALRTSAPPAVAKPIAWVDVRDTYEGPYTFHGLELLPVGKHDLFATPPAAAHEFMGWYCTHCRRGVDSSEVTFHEQHKECGRVITDDRPPAPVEDACLVATVPALLQLVRKGREALWNERESLVHAHSGPDGMIEEDIRPYIDDLDALIQEMDSAIAKATGGTE